MKKATCSFVAFCSLILCINEVSAQLPTLSGGCSSAGSLAQPVRFNCDFAGEPGDSVFLRHRAQADTAFSEAAMDPVNEIPNYEFTYETDVSFGADPGILEYYFHVRRDTLMATQSPKNTANQYPPPSFKYLHFIPDPQGDTGQGSLGNWLDLTTSGMSYSDTRLYCYLRNVSGTWPHGQFPYYFIYSMGFMITSGADTSLYALFYANIPLLPLTSGLFVINRADSSFTRIGNINTSIWAGTLHMACDLSAFEADPGWPGWPPPEGYITPIGATMTAGPSEQYANDNTYPSLYQPQTQFLDFAANGPPILFSGEVAFDTAGIYPSVGYLDGEGNLPLTRLFHFDSDAFVMGSPDHGYTDSSRFDVTLAPPSEGWHRYYFEFSDGVLTAATDVDSFRVIPSGQCHYVPGDINNVPPANGIDITYGVAYLKGGNPPPVYCDMCPAPLYAAMDVNGSCSTNGIDITYFVGYLKGGPALMYCATCPPAGR